VLKLEAENTMLKRETTDQKDKIKTLEEKLKEVER